LRFEEYAMRTPYSAYNSKFDLPIARNARGKTIRIRKGFVLTELLVVLVIIVLLAAILLPFAFDRIEEAKKNAEIADAHTIAVAMQSLMTLAYADGRNDELLDKTDIYNIRLTARGKEEINDLMNMEAGPVTHIKIDDNNTVNGFVYVTEKGSRIVYDEGKFTVVELY
jgi:prepilin-type N-terminal cleavage/methylation domain-containing protein